MHAQVQCLDVVEDEHDPPAFSRFSISSTSKLSDTGTFSSFMLPSLIEESNPRDTVHPLEGI
jgi:hypothetical protein